MGYCAERTSFWRGGRFFVGVRNTLSIYVRHTAWLNATPTGSDKPRREYYSTAQQELVDLDEYEQHIIKLWREVGSVSQSGMGVAPLVWGEVIEWVNKFYLTDRVVMVPSNTIKTTDKVVRDWLWRHRTVRETETIVEEIPVVIKQSSLEDYEVELIMQLSREYCDEYHSAVDPARDCPREIFVDDINATENADAILAGFQQLFGVSVNNKPEIVK